MSEPIPNQAAARTGPARRAVTTGRGSSSSGSSCRSSATCCGSSSSGPHVPPGRMSTTAIGAAFDFNVLFVIALPVMIGVWVYMAYAIFAVARVEGRRRPGRRPDVPGPPRHRGDLDRPSRPPSCCSSRASAPTSSSSPRAPAAARDPYRRCGPRRRTTSSQVQVIGQQWKWTYRYPSFGGFETNELVVPVNTTIAFHVTSLDVIHDFWAYQLGREGRRQPERRTTSRTRRRSSSATFIVRCDELCGLWHGAMYNDGPVVSKTAFEQWATRDGARARARTPSTSRRSPTPTCPTRTAPTAGTTPTTWTPTAPSRPTGPPTPANGMTRDA